MALLWILEQALQAQQHPIAYAARMLRAQQSPGEVVTQVVIASADAHEEKKGTHDAVEENIDVITFDEPSKAYQALHVLQETDAQARIGLLEAAVVERTSDGRIQMSEVAEGQAALVGSVIYVLDGPLHPLLSDPLMDTLLLTRAPLDLSQAQQDDPSLKQIADQMKPGSTVLIADVVEVTDDVLDKEMRTLGGTVTRRPTADIVQEIAAADAAKRAADKEARRVLREQHQAQRQADFEKQKAQVQQQVAQQQTAFEQKMADLRQAHQQRVDAIKAKLHAPSAVKQQ